jgi:hypothetical protein
MGDFFKGYLLGVAVAIVCILSFFLGAVKADDSSTNSASGNAYARDGD